MKVQTQVELSDGSKLTIESPKIYGLTALDRIARVLDGESVQSVFPKDQALDFPSDFGPETRGEFVAIFMDDAPLGQPRQATRIFVTQWPLQAQIFAGAVLQRTQNRWHAYVGVAVDITTRDAPAFLIREPWAIVLAQLVRDELALFLRLATNLERRVDANIAREIASRCNFYSQRDLMGFFADSSLCLVWEIAAAWPGWDERGLPPAKRLREIRVQMGPIQVTDDKFAHLCSVYSLKPSETKAGPRKGISKAAKSQTKGDVVSSSLPELFSLLRNKSADSNRRLSEFRGDEELKTIFLGGTYPANDKDASLSDRELELVRDWSPENDAVFSYGGAPEDFYDLDPKIRGSFSKRGEPTLRDLVDRYWWWKSLNEDFVGTTLPLVDGDKERDTVKDPRRAAWPENRKELFLDNWEWSAFCYELRARYNGRYHWDPFGKPWVKLNFTERGILACLWPTKHVGSHTIQPKLSPVVLQKMKSVVVLKLTHNLQTPIAKLNDRIFQEIIKLAGEAGYSVPGKGEGGRRKLPWRALQVLDFDYLLGRKFQDNVTKLRQIIERYETACNDVGLRP